MTKNSILAFTLAEVLITLSVIGVITAITIPTLMQNTQKQDTTTKVQKAYTTLAQAIKKSELDNGPIESWNYNIPNGQFMNTYVAPYLNIVKNCGPTAGCWAGDRVNYIKSSGFDNNTDTANIILSDGTFLSGYTNTDHTHFRIDIDGKKGPTRYGRDVFMFTLTPGPLFESGRHNIEKAGLYPYGAGLDRETILTSGQGCNKNATGGGCTALIMLDGWQIKDDYPW